MTNNEKIIKFVTKNGASTATAIAKGAIGTSKANAGLKTALKVMASSGALIEDCTGRYTTYSIGSGNTPASNVSGEIVKMTNENVKPVESAPSNIVKVLPGYDVTQLEKASLGKVKIEGPNGQVAELEGEEYLIVINGEFWRIGKTASDVITAISIYTVEHGMATIVVKDIKTNASIGGAADVELDESRIISLSVAKHNKAA